MPCAAVRDVQDQARCSSTQASPAILRLTAWPVRMPLDQTVDRTKQPPEPKYEAPGSKILYGPYKDFAANLALSPWNWASFENLTFA